MNKILICHPDEKTREYLKLALCDHHVLMLMNTVPQALFTLENTKDYKALLIGISGSEEFTPEAIKPIKKKYSNLKIFALAERRETEEAKEAIKCGATGCIFKPFKPEEIISLMK